MPVAAAETARKIQQDVLRGLSWNSRMEAQVKSPGSLLRTDADIARTVRLTLEWDALLPGQKIRSTVSEGGSHSRGSSRRCGRRRTRSGSCVSSQASRAFTIC